MLINANKSCREKELDELVYNRFPLFLNIPIFSWIKQSTTRKTPVLKQTMKSIRNLVKFMIIGMESANWNLDSKNVNNQTRRKWRLWKQSRYYKTDSSQKLSSDEEEDMANCLIMLAQSQSVSPAKEDKSDRHSQKTEKLKNRTLTEMAATIAGGNSDFHNYECKTCNRAFPSF